MPTGVERQLQRSKHSGFWASAKGAQKVREKLLCDIGWPMPPKKPNWLGRLITSFPSFRARLSPSTRLAIGSAMCAYILGYLRFDHWWVALVAALGGLLIGKYHHGP